MQTPWYQAVPLVMDQVELLQPASILEIGVGLGKYGLMFRDVLEPGWPHSSRRHVTIEGIELGNCEPPYEGAYDRVWDPPSRVAGPHLSEPGSDSQTAERIMALLRGLPVYDFVFVDGVLEILTKAEGLELVRCLLEHAKHGLMVTLLLDPSPQVAKFLAHPVSDATGTRWSAIDFVDFDFSWRMVPGRKSAIEVLSFFPPQRVRAAAGARTRGKMPRPLGDGKEVPASGTGVGRFPLTIAYLMPHKYVTGGLRMLLEQIRFLRRKGHTVVALGKDDRSGKVLPGWTDVEADREIVVPANQSFANYVGGCDVVVAGWCEQLVELAGSPVPVVYWEQGHEVLFGQVDDLFHDSLMRRRFARCYEPPCYLAATSDVVARALLARYGREAHVIPPGIDTELFHPGNRRGPGTVLLVGNPLLPFKGFDVALRVLSKVWDSGVRFRVKWVCQSAPRLGVSAEYPLEFILNPSQEGLAEAYRSSNVFLFTSWYEGFGLPPLEAMASGTPVVTTACGGVDSYVSPGENALVADPGDVDSLAYAVAYLLKNPEVCEHLATNGRRTALRFDIKQSVEEFERFLARAVGCQG